MAVTSCNHYKTKNDKVQKYVFANSYKLKYLTYI